MSPPYDVFDESTRDGLARSNPHNIVHIDYPVERDGPDRYARCAATLDEWVRSGVVSLDENATFSLYRMVFTDESGRRRSTVGVIGALEVVDEGAEGVLPHERTTPKAKTDRLDLTRATSCNLSPVWGLSLTAGLSGLLTEQAEVVARVVDIDGVHLPAGSKLLLLVGAANRDPRRWGDDADVFDIDRNAGGQLSFGMGIHQCVGQPISRQESDALITALAERVATLELTDAPTPFVHNTLRGWTSLPARVG